MLSRRTVHLDGFRIHKLFCLIENNNSSIYHIAELAIQCIMGGGLQILHMSKFYF